MIIITILLLILALVFILLKSDLFRGSASADISEKAPKLSADTPEATRKSDDKFPDKLRAGPIPPDESVPANLLVFESRMDTVWIGVKRKTRADASKLLLRGKVWKVAYSDTVRIHTGMLGAVRIHTGGKILVPDKRRFMVYKGNLIE